MNKLTITTPNDQAKRLLAIRYKRDQLREALNVLDGEYDALRDALLVEMRKNRVMSLKTEAYTITRKSVTNPFILNSDEAIKDMQKRGIEPIIKLDLVANKQMLLLAVRDGRPIKGTDIKVTEYVTIKQASKE